MSHERQEGRRLRRVRLHRPPDLRVPPRVRRPVRRRRPQRGQARVVDAANVAGIETADYEVQEVDHDVERLAELFDGATVVCNTVGPFSTLGAGSSRPRLKAGVHYTDTTGEQDWLMACDDALRRRLRRGRAAPRARHRADVHHRRDRRPALPGQARPRHPRHRRLLGRLPDDRLDRDDPGQRRLAARRTSSSRTRTSASTRRPGLVPLVVPGQHELAQSLPWGGTSHPVWFKHDPRVANCKAQGGVFNAALMNGVPQIVARRARGHQGHDRRATGPPPSTATAAPGDGPDAAAGEPAGQQVARLGARLRPARAARTA